VARTTEAKKSAEIITVCPDIILTSLEGEKTPETVSKV
jgi:molybdenum cofactor biosynthesis enzyme